MDSDGSPVLPRDRSRRKHAPRRAPPRAFVGHDAEPREVVLETGLGARHVALEVGVLDAQHERSVMPAHEQLVDERGARAAEVQLAGW
jgi:hypothetical protein